MSRPLKALIVEDNPDDATLLLLALKGGGFDVAHKRVDTAEAFDKALTGENWDIIFSDHSMPRFSSFEALEMRNNRELDIPFVILSGEMGEDLAVEAMKAGASDYFVKGKLTRLAAVVNRELQEAQHRQMKRQTEAELKQFMASLVHDLRTPLVGELRILELLQSGSFGEVSERQQMVIDELVQSNHFVQHLVDNVLYAYKYKQCDIPLDRETLDLGDYIRLIADSLTVHAWLKEKRQVLEIEGPEKLPPVYADPNEIRRVVFNLLKNAMDYTPSGGTITLTLSVEGECIRVEVRDSGTGVDPRVEPLLFTLHPNTDKKYHKLGLGLGLYLSRQIIEAHDGSIAFERLPEGSLFYFRIPVKR